MFDDEESSAKKQVFIEQRMLDPVSIADLRLYIEALRAEILRAEEEIARKQGARGHADSFLNFEEVTAVVRHRLDGQGRTPGRHASRGD